MGCPTPLYIVSASASLKLPPLVSVLLNGAKETHQDSFQNYQNLISKMIRVLIYQCHCSSVYYLLHFYLFISALESSDQSFFLSFQAKGGTSSSVLLIHPGTCSIPGQFPLTPHSLVNCPFKILFWELPVGLAG